MAMMPFRARLRRRRLPIRSRVLLSGFLKAPLIAGRIHDACRATARHSRRDAREFNGADENNQSCGEFGVMFHGSSIAHWQGVMACRSIGIGAEPFHVRPAQTIHTNAITQGVSIMSRYRMPVESAAS